MKSLTPKISIVIPCFNDGEYIDETLDSVFRQTFQDFEIIIVDDGSDAPTQKKLSDLKHKKIKLITQSNKGLSAARNIGIQNSNGLYILILDSDDTFDYSFLEKANLILDTDSSIGAVSSYCNIFIKNHQIVSKHEPIGGGISNFMFDNNSVAFALIRKQEWERIGGYDEKMRNGFEDWEFWINMTKSGGEIYIIPEYLFNYRQKQKNSLAKDAKMHFREENLYYIYKKHQDIYIQKFPETLEYIIQLAKRNRNNELKVRNTIDYKIGTFLLKPFRFVKHLF